MERRAFGDAQIALKLLAKLVDPASGLGFVVDVSIESLLQDDEASLLRRLRPAPAPPCFECPDCGRRSFHPDDIRYGYCGACHTFPEQRTR